MKKYLWSGFLSLMLLSACNFGNSPSLEDRIPEDDSRPEESPTDAEEVEEPESITTETEENTSQSFLNDAQLELSMILRVVWVYAKQENMLQLFTTADALQPVVDISQESLDTPEGRGLAAEIEQGTEISVGGSRAFRFIDGQNTTVYILRPTNILELAFSGTESERAQFYNLLLSVQFPTEVVVSTAEENQMCGGIAGLSCPTGYRCELDGDYPDASGQCVLAINEEGNASSTREELPAAKEILRSPPNPTLENEQNEAEDTESTPESSEESVTTDTPNIDPDMEAEQPEAAPSDGYRLYESTHYNFSIEYPKNGYYAHLGSAGESVSTVVFSDEPIESVENAKLQIEIVSGVQNQENRSANQILLPRDENSHFRISTSLDSWNTAMNHMADSLRIAEAE